MGLFREFNKDSVNMPIALEIYDKNDNSLTVKYPPRVTLLQSILLSRKEPAKGINNAGFDGQTALMQAAANGHKDVCEWLISLPEINIWQQNKSTENNPTQTALAMASKMNRINIVELFLSKEPDKEIIHEALNNAAIAGHEKMVDLLLQSY